MAEKIDLSILILNYNTKDLLKKCLNSLLVAVKKSFSTETIVVDNASTDDSVEMIKKEFSWVKLIESQKNLGFAAGNNLGLRKTRGKYVLLLNPDTQLFPETLRVILTFMEENQKVGIATCKVELPDGKLDDACHRGFPTPWNAFCYFSDLGKIFPKSSFFNGYHLGYYDLDKIHEIDACVGAFMMIRKEVGESLNWFDEDYFWYGEDLDFCFRAKKLGWKVMFIPEVKILHWKGVSSGIKKESQEISTASQETKRRAAKASTEAMRIFYGKHYVDIYPKVITGLVLFGIDTLEKLRLSNLNN